MSASAARATTPAAPRGRLGLELAVFFGLAVFVSQRYGSLLTAPPLGRLMLVAACVTMGSALLAASGVLGRGAWATLVRALLVLATLVLSLLALRIPAHLLVPEGWARLTSDVRGGVNQLGGWLWPYRGDGRWARAAVLLPVPAVLVAAGGICFWPSRSAVATRRVIAVAALVAIFLTGTANAPGALPAVDGLVLLALTAGALLLPLASAPEAARAARWLAACGVAALLAQGALRSSHPWLHYRDGTGAAPGAFFQWDQLYGPIPWSRSAAPMFTVQEGHPELLRVTSLDRFDGLRFLRSVAPPGSRRLDLGASAANRRRWAHSATLEIQALRSPLLVGAGGLVTAARWLGAYSAPLLSAPDGTAYGGQVPQGALYEVRSYDPEPSPQEARSAPRAFPAAYLPYTQFELPASDASALHAPNLAADASAAPSPQLLVGAPAPGRSPASDAVTAALIEASPYAPMFALAQRLAAGAPSSYDVAVRMERFLHTGYAYDEHVRLSRYPLEAFLFTQRRGYCEQFSGAMTLMLRMDGIPARVGAGFRPSAFDPLSGTWSVRALDAHTWVEVFLAGIGWVSFDPTPAAAGAAGASSLPVSKGSLLGSSTGHGAAGSVAAVRARAAAQRASAGGFPAVPVALAVAAALALLVLAACLRGRRRLASSLAGGAEGAVAELGAALARAGQASPRLTLVRLEEQLAAAGHGAAAAYARGLREQRYAAASTEAARPRERAAMRRALAAAGGVSGWARALAALPPGWARGPRQR
jgi:transglutaminase-like putative cysteine protease